MRPPEFQSDLRLWVTGRKGPLQVEANIGLLNTVLIKYIW